MMARPKMEHNFFILIFLLRKPHPYKNNSFTNYQGLWAPTSGDALFPSSLVSTQQVPSSMASYSSSSYSSSSESSSVLPPEVLPPLNFLSRLSPLSSSLGSGSSPPLPISPGLEVMAPFLEAGRDLVLGLSLADDVLLEELPEFDPSFLLESAFSMIFPWLWLMLLLMSISFSVFSRQKVPKPTTAIKATMMVMLRGVKSFLGFRTCLRERSSASVRVGSTSMECCSWWEEGSGNTLSITEIYI